MVFSSLTFLFYFLPLTLLLCFFKKSIRWRNGVLLCASLLFYAWGEPVWVLAMVGSTAVNYISARNIVRARSRGARRLWLIFGVGVSAGLLFAFKYAAFFANTFLAVFGAHKRIEGPALPIGISFYTFQVITYTVDVYRRKAPLQKRFTSLLLYVCCFPQLIAGPIVQYSDVASQIERRTTTPDMFSSGMKRFAVGLGKKVIFANICGAALAATPQAGTASLSFVGAWYSAFLYTLQIYFDFAGYSDMAIGVGRVLGFTYKENFVYPYVSCSVREFWRRWHVSLGSFFRDYVYIPLGGNRMGLKRTLINTFVVWLLTGLWHGANWTFIVWGLFYGVLLTLDTMHFGKAMQRVPGIVNWLITMVLVMIGWVIFYYPTLHQGLSHIGAMLGVGAKGFIDAQSLRIIKTYSVFPLIAFAASMPIVPALEKLPLSAHAVEIFSTVFLSACMLVSILLLVGQSYNPFIYFQF